MRNINLPMLLLAFLVVFMFSLVGVAVAYRSILFMALFLLLGFALMGYGIVLKRKSNIS